MVTFCSAPILKRGIVEVLVEVLGLKLEFVVVDVVVGAVKDKQ